MTTYNVGADHSGNGDQACIDAVCKVLEDAGHTANKLGVNPNLESQLNTGNTSDIGVFLVNGGCLGTWLSCNEMVKGGGCSHVYFGFPKPIMSPPFNDKNNLNNPAYKPVLVDDGSAWKSEWKGKYEGKYTVEEFFNLPEIDGVSYVWGETCEEVANAILNGDTSSGSGTTTEEDKGSIMSGWESITDLLKPLDGEAMVIVRGDVVMVKRIFIPESTKLWVYEGINVVADSVRISDYSPEIYNTFTIKWGENFEYEFEISFKKHKELFGERKTEVNAVYQVPLVDEESTGGSDSTGESSYEDMDMAVSSSTGIFGFISSRLSGESDTNINPDINAVTLNDESLEGGSDEDTPKIKEIPISDEGEAYLFGLKQVGLAQRLSGHQIECKVIGSKYWEVGEWAKVYLPSFNEENIMFISKVSHDSSADSEWLTNLTLVDYPPSLGKGQSNTPQSSTDETMGSDVGDATLNDANADPSNPENSDTDTSAGTDNGGENNG